MLRHIRYEEETLSSVLYPELLCMVGLSVRHKFFEPG